MPLGPANSSNTLSGQQEAAPTSHSNPALLWSPSEALRAVLGSRSTNATQVPISANFEEVVGEGESEWGFRVNEPIDGELLELLASNSIHRS